MKKTLILLLLFLLIFPASLVWALSKKEKWKLLNNFKREEYEMIFESDASLIGNDDLGVLTTSRKINIYNSIGKNIKTKREYLEFQNKKIVNRVTSLRDSIKELDENIKDIVKEVNKINYEIVETKRQMGVNKSAISLLKEKINKNTQIILDYISYMYKKWSYLSDNNDIDILKTIFLWWEDIAAVINDLHYKGIIQLTWQKLIKKHRSYISKLYVKKLELSKDELKLKKLRKTSMLEKSILDDKKTAKNRLLEITEWKEDLYKKYIKEKLAIEKNIKLRELKERIKLNNTRGKLLKKYGCDFVDISKNTVESRALFGKCLDVNKIIYAESKLKDVDISDNPFSWPVKPYNGISAYFKDEEYRNDFNEEHDAIDIITPQWTEVKAPMDGYVIHIEPPLNSGYSYIAIKHSSGLVTIYGHLSKIFVKDFDFIKKGEVFALSWWEYGTKWAGILTTWPHLHFWVYEDKEYVDPLELLNTSFLSYEGIKEKYKFKFKTDFKKRKWYEYTKESCEWKKWVFCIKWVNEVERQKYLLSTYAVGSFRDWNIWVEESIDAWLDPTFLMCIGLAETGLWKYLKTPYNVWNVWNTDSWAVKSFNNARSWVYAMTLTLNNKFLGGYNKISDLSRYGNKKWVIYASSEENWHNNIIKCMSHIKWEYVPGNFNFRLSR